MSNDEIKMDVNVQLTDKSGQPIEVRTQQPEYMVETFSFDNANNLTSEIVTGNEE